jgi:hypothetical protein
MIHLRTRSTATKLASGAAAFALLGGGTAVAAGLPDSFVQSRHIKDGAVRSVDLANGSVTGQDVDEGSLGLVPIAEAAGTADHAISAGHAGTAGRLLGLSRATVSASGQLRSPDFGAVSAEQTDVPGRYVVNFGGPLLGCFLMAGVGHNEMVPTAGSASAWIAPLAVNPNLSKVTVETHAPGSGDTVPDPLPFNLMVVC